MSSRIALLGPNGIGKTTLINIITEKVKLIQGDFYRDQKARIAHFS
jgi:ATPase subunit of ABC transporter with duplicated ATPase domains